MRLRSRSLRWVNLAIFIALALPWLFVIPKSIGVAALGIAFVAFVAALLVPPALAYVDVLDEVTVVKCYRRRRYRRGEIWRFEVDNFGWFPRMILNDRRRIALRALFPPLHLRSRATVETVQRLNNWLSNP